MFFESDFAIISTALLDVCDPSPKVNPFGKRNKKNMMEILRDEFTGVGAIPLETIWCVDIFVQSTVEMHLRMQHDVLYGSDQMCTLGRQPNPNMNC